MTPEARQSLSTFRSIYHPLNHKAACVFHTLPLRCYVLILEYTIEKHDPCDSWKHVLFLKAYDAKYEQHCQENGYRAYFCPLLDYEWTNQDVLKQILLSQLNQYSGIILTSPRASEALIEIYNNRLSTPEQEQVLTALHRLRIYVVGQATAHGIETTLGLSTFGKESGSACHLATYLLHEPATGPMLFLCGEKKRTEIPHSFRARDQVLVEVMVYRAHAKPQIDFPRVGGKTNIFLWCVFFSASSLTALSNVVLHDDCCCLQAIQKLAIGKNTAKALENHARETGEMHWNPTNVAGKPTIEGIMQAIQQSDRR